MVAVEDVCNLVSNDCVPAIAAARVLDQAVYDQRVACVSWVIEKSRCTGGQIVLFIIGERDVRRQRVNAGAEINPIDSPVIVCVGEARLCRKLVNYVGVISHDKFLWLRELTFISHHRFA